MKILNVLLLFIITTSAFCQQFDSYKWSTLDCTGEPAARHEASFIEANGEFYLMGGRRIQEVSIFNPKTNTWSSGAKPPIELHHFQGVNYKDNIYVFGAQTGKYPHETSLQESYIYNPKLDNWEKGPSVPDDRIRGSAGTVVYKDKLFMVCGIIDGHMQGHVTWFDCYDFKTDTWSKLPDAPRYRDHFSAVVCNNKLYLIGGRVTSGSINKVFELTVPEVDVYDFKTGEWTTLDNNVITQRAGCMTVAYKNRILFVGGESVAQKNAHSEVEMLNTKTGAWEPLPSLNRGRHGSQLVWYKKSVFVASGCGNRGGSPELQTIECFSGK